MKDFKKIYVLNVEIGNSSENYLRDFGFLSYNKALDYLFKMYRVDIKDKSEDNLDFIQDLKNSVREITISNKTYK